MEMPTWCKPSANNAMQIVVPVCKDFHQNIFGTLQEEYCRVETNDGTLTNETYQVLNENQC